jgi:peptide deformylase
MSRIIAIDYGKKRTGIAVSDTLQMIANGLTTVPTHELLAFIMDYVAKEPVERILVGLPKQMNNEASENMKRIEPFVRSLQKRLPIRVVVVDLDVLSEDYPEYKGFRKAYINAHILEVSGEEVSMEEGCLSLPGIHESVKRGNKIRVKYLDEDLVEHDEIVEGYLARVMQHEFDHLDGKMFIDHLSPLRRQMIKGKLNAMLKGKAHCTYKVKTVK